MSERGLETLHPDEVIWHDLECGAYAADLSLWRALAARQGSPILELGAGTGRVALDLARHGHQVTALDNDGELLAALRGRARDLPVSTVLADARNFALEKDFALCLMPMQTVQLLGGAAGRALMLTCARSHLRPGGLLALALTTELEPYRVASAAAAPLPDTCESCGSVFFSQPTAIFRVSEGYVLERRRETVSSAGARTVAHYRVALDDLSTHQLEREGRECGFEPAGRMAVPATPEHSGSEVVVLRA